ncbi:MAG: ornithine carbamoyltransferase, partial [bacterium]
LAYVGDGNNVAHSLMLLAAKLGMNCTIGCPVGYTPNAQVTAQASIIGAETGAKIAVLHDPIAAVTGADAVYTDVWTSMGQEQEREERLRVFPPFQINAGLLIHANPGALIMHCLPAHRGEEITEEAVESKCSVIFDEAENRLHAQKAVLALGMGWLPD